MSDGESKMKVEFCPQDKGSGCSRSGCSSFASWNNPEVIEAIRHIFHESPREQLVRCVVDKDGLTAFFELRK